MRGRWGGGAVAVGGKNYGSGKGRRKRRAPWGNILGGKPIVRHAFMFDRRIDLSEDTLRRLQYVKMVELKRHYQIQGGEHDFPIKGLAPAPWLPWYELALAIASELDDSLKIADAPPPGKTARRWRGIQGEVLLDLVDLCKELRPQRTIQMCLKQLQKRYPQLKRYSLRELAARHSEVKRDRRNYEAARNKARTS